VAWLEGEKLHFTHVDDELGVAPVEAVPLSGGDGEIVAPLFSAEVVDTTVRPAGGALLVQGDPRGRQFGLQSLQLGPQQWKAIGSATLPGPKPLWLMSHVRTGKKAWLVTYLQTSREMVALSLAQWPGVPGSLAAPVRLAEWRGEPIAAGGSTGADDTLRCGVLLWKKRKDTPRSLVLLACTISPTNDLQQQEQVIEWHPNTEVREARVAVSDTGRTVALIADMDGVWHLYDGQGNVQSVPAEFQKSRQPLEPVFLDGVGEPLLICGTVGQGLRIVQLDGSPLPPRVAK